MAGPDYPGLMSPELDTPPPPPPPPPTVGKVHSMCFLVLVGHGPDQT